MGLKNVKTHVETIKKEHIFRGANLRSRLEAHNDSSSNKKRGSI